MIVAGFSRSNDLKGRIIRAATVDGETTLKRLDHRGERVLLTAANSAYRDIEVQSEDFVIHGVAVGLLRRLSPLTKAGKRGML